MTNSTAPRTWFLRGMMVGLLIASALNSLSYFWQSADGGNLLGRKRDAREAIGFPVEMWESGNSYGGYFVDYRAMLINVGCALAFGACCGMAVMSLRHRLDRLVAELEAKLDSRVEQRHSFQFSMRGLLLSTTVVAILAACMRQALSAKPEALGAIYALGPWLLVGIAFVPRMIPWQHRVGLIIPLTFGLMMVAVAIGGTINRDLEDVLMGIFVCWTPQAVLVAALLTLLLTVSHRYNLFPSLFEST